MPARTTAAFELRTCPGCERKGPPEARFCGGCGFDLDQEGRPSISADPLIGRVIAERYRILDLLGRGGMGVVYRVEHTHIGKTMAMKLLHGELARDRDVVRRFRREAEAASRLSHPNTAQIFDFGSSEGMMYLVMELIEGRDLGELLREHPEGLDFGEAARIGVQVCASVAEAHAAGIIHRDLKPENVMLTQREDGAHVAKVVDFGLAKLRDGSQSHTLTRAGAIVGTPYFMSPEQIRGEDVDARGDVYSIGAMLYKTITGTPPFNAQTPMGVLTKHLMDDLEPPSQRAKKSLPAVADEIVAKAMAREPEDRYPDVRALSVDLLAYLHEAGESTSQLDLALASNPGAPAVTIVETREELDRYENRLRAFGVARKVGVLLLAGVLVGAGAFFARGASGPEPSTREEEPNNRPSEANALFPDVSLEAYLGRRIGVDEGDADVYRLVRGPLSPASSRERVDVIVTGIRNIDLVMELIREGRTLPELEVDNEGVGGGESLVGFPLGAGEYFVRVRQRVVPGEHPIENVSDAYRIGFLHSTPGVGEEREGNDALESAQHIAVGSAIRGRIGWRHDVDLFCLDRDAPRVRAELVGVPGLDLVLRTVDRARDESFKVDETGVGGNEVHQVEGARAGESCFEVSVDLNDATTRAANPSIPYQLELSAEADGG